MVADLPTHQPHCLDAHIHQSASLSFCVTPLLKRLRWYRNFNLLSIDYAFRPRLRSRLTLRGRAFLRNLRLSADKILTYLFVTHTGILTCMHSTSPYGLDFNRTYNAPLPHTIRCPSIASVVCLAPLHFRRRVTRPVSYYALFKWWLLLSQHPGCLCNSTSFPT